MGKGETVRVCKLRVLDARPEGGREGRKDRRRGHQAEGTEGMGALRGPGGLCPGAGVQDRVGQDVWPGWVGGASEAGVGGDCRPYPESNAKLLRGFKQLSERGDEICISKRSLSLMCREWIRRTRGYCCGERGQRGEYGQIERFRVGVDTIWRLVGFVGRGRRRGPRVSSLPLGVASGQQTTCTGVSCTPPPHAPSTGHGSVVLVPSSLLKAARGARMCGQVAAAQLLSTVSVPVNMYACTEGHKSMQTRTVPMCTHTLRPADRSTAPIWIWMPTRPHTYPE